LAKSSARGQLRTAGADKVNKNIKMLSKYTEYDKQGAWQQG
jgi:hypothetical protein